MSEITNKDPRLYNETLAPLSSEKKNWGWFEIFNVWANDVQSLFGYTLAVSLFLAYGLNGWAVFAALILAGFFIMWLVNLSGSPSVRHGIPYPVFARASMGVFGANFPAMARGIVAIFWYGAQTYFASTAVALLLNRLLGIEDGGSVFLEMNAIGWVSILLVGLFQIYLFWKGIDVIRKFLNFAGPAVYVVMIILMITVWFKAGGGLISEVGNIFSGMGDYTGSSVNAFFLIFGTMVAYFAAVVINYGDFARFVSDESEMRKGNLLGLVGNIIVFSFIALMITAGSVVVFGEALRETGQITDMVKEVDSLLLTIVAAFAFFTATVGINMVANYIPPAFDLSNLVPSKIDFRTGGLITGIVGLILAILWVSVITQMGLFPFVNTLGAVLAPVYGIMILDYYILKNQELDVQALFSAEPGSKYYYDNGWNIKAFIALAIAAIYAEGMVWGYLPDALNFGGGYAWIVGAALGAVLHYGIQSMSKKS